MPCRDYPDDYTRDRDIANRTAQELRARNDKLAAELCVLRGFILRLADVLDADQLDANSARILANVRQAHLVHRQHDRTAHIEILSRKIAVLEGRMKLIRANGGLVHPDQEDEMASLVASRDKANALTPEELLSSNVGF